MGDEEEHPELAVLADALLLAELLTVLTERFGGYEVCEHWMQGEFHHDLVLRVGSAELPGSFLVVSTNCNGGVKEVLALGEMPRRWALWNHRCPDNADFDGELSPVLGRVRTMHWFDPCELLDDDARSELKPEHRTWQRGGGWQMSGGEHE